LVSIPYAVRRRFTMHVGREHVESVLIVWLPIAQNGNEYHLIGKASPQSCTRKCNLDALGNSAPHKFERRLL
jgi:hypothetical protein